MCYGFVKFVCHGFLTPVCHVFIELGTARAVNWVSTASHCYCKENGILYIIFLYIIYTYVDFSLMHRCICHLWPVKALGRSTLCAVVLDMLFSQD